MSGIKERAKANVTGLLIRVRLEMEHGTPLPLSPSPFMLCVHLDRRSVGGKLLAKILENEYIKILFIFPRQLGTD